MIVGRGVPVTVGQAVPPPQPSPACPSVQEIRTRGRLWFRKRAALQNVPWLALHDTKVACIPIDIWRTTGVGCHLGNPQEKGPLWVGTACPCGRGEELSPPGPVSSHLAPGIPWEEAASLSSFSQARQQQLWGWISKTDSYGNVTETRARMHTQPV